MARNSHVSLETLICITIVVTVSSSATDEFGGFLVLREEPSDATFLVNSRMREVVFRCDVEGSPEPIIRWFRNGDQLGKNDKYRINGDKNLEVQFPNRTNHGDKFMCDASNSFGKLMSRNATLEIAYTEEFPSDRPPVSVRLAEYLGRCLPCDPPNASPGIQTIWNKDRSGNIVEDERVAVLSDGRLCFAYLENSDSGTYQCSVANSFDNEGGLAVSYVRSPNTVDVEVTDSNGPPYQSLIPEVATTDTVTVMRGQTAVLECFFLGRPQPTHTWTRNNGEIPAKALSTTKSLVITDAQTEDSGEYTCQGRSGSRSSIVKRTLVVISPPVLITELDANRNVTKRNNVSFRCDTDGNDAFEWFFNAQPIIPTDRVQLMEENTRLHIQKAKMNDSGIYQCRATNQYGSVLSTTQLKVMKLRKSKGSGEEDSETVEQPNIPEATGNDRGSSEVKQASMSLLITTSLLTSLITHRLLIRD